MNHHPVPKSAELFQRLEELSRPYPLDEMSMLRLKRELEAFKAVDVAEAFNLLGIAAAIRGDENSSRHHHQEAIRRIKSASYHANFGASLLKFHRFEEAAIELHRAFALAPDDLVILSTAIDTALCAFQLDNAARLHHEWRKRVPNRDHQAAEILSRIIAAVAKLNIDTDQVRHYNEVVGKFFRSYHQRHDIGCSFRVLGIAEELSISMLFVVENASLEESFDIDCQLSAYLAENVEDLLGGDYSVQVVGGA